MANYRVYHHVLFVTFVFALSMAARPADKADTSHDPWLTALPFNRMLDVQQPLLKGNDIVILQNLLRRHGSIKSLVATGNFDEDTKQALKVFQQEENLSQQNGILDPETARKIIKLLLHDGYKDDGTCPPGSKFKLYVPLYRNRNIETIATLYKCDDSPKVLHTFKIRARGGTKKGHPLNQLTSNGDTPTGLSKIDLNSKFPDGRLTDMFGPYPILRIVKGVAGNVAIGKDSDKGIRGRDTFLNDYRFGILVHTGRWKNWNKNLPMPNSLGCLKVHPDDQKKIVELLIKEVGVLVRKNTFGKSPYLHTPQGYISVEEID